MYLAVVEGSPAVAGKAAVEGSPAEGGSPAVRGSPAEEGSPAVGGRVAGEGSPAEGAGTQPGDTVVAVVEGSLQQEMRSTNQHTPVGFFTYMYHPSSLVPRLSTIHSGRPGILSQASFPGFPPFSAQGPGYYHRPRSQAFHYSRRKA